MPKVLNWRVLRDEDKLYPLNPSSDQIYVGRPTMWGNPYVIGKDGSRDEVIEMYRDYLLSSPDLMHYLFELRGKDLICWCAPEACHADVLLDLANKE